MCISLLRAKRTRLDRVSPRTWRPTGMAALLSAAFLLAVPLCCTAAEGTTDETQPAVWTPKELTFVYQGFTTKYSCDGLRDKVMRALLQLGARKKDLKVEETACTRGFGRPDIFPGVRIKMNVLAPATDTSADSPDVVQARWKPVDLKL